MRKVTNNVVNAFLANRDFKSGNDQVLVINNGKCVQMLLHSHPIAEKKDNKLFINNCGYFTNVTKERLNGLPNVHIQQKKGVWYLNGKEWNGERIEVK